MADLVLVAAANVGLAWPPILDPTTRNLVTTVAPAAQRRGSVR